MDKDKSKKTGVGTLTVFVIVSFFSAAIFTAVCLYFNWQGRIIQDSVVSGFYSLFTAEFGITGGIQVVKTIRSLRQARKESIEMEAFNDE